jgi:hypothetical protein
MLPEEVDVDLVELEDDVELAFELVPEEDLFVEKLPDLLFVRGVVAFAVV